MHSLCKSNTFKVYINSFRMPPSKLKCHEDCREAICTCCGIKTDKKRITANEELMVRAHAKPEYDSTVQSFPAGLCSTCRYIILNLLY